MVNSSTYLSRVALTPYLWGLISLGSTTLTLPVLSQGILGVFVVCLLTYYVAYKIQQRINLKAIALSKLYFSLTFVGNLAFLLLTIFLAENMAIYYALLVISFLFNIISILITNKIIKATSNFRQ